MKENPILIAFQTGWLSVEAFGLLRRYALHGRNPSPEKVDERRRFRFTDRDQNLTEQLQSALQMLKSTASQLLPEMHPPIPDDPSELLGVTKKDIPPYWSRFEEWSSRVWNELQISNPLAGQAFICGGDLADTYWYAQRAGADKLAEMLDSYRLTYIAERLNDFSNHLPEVAVLAIQHSLERWSIGEQVKERDFDRQKDLLERLESQAKVWRDLLFGLRQGNSYLKPNDRRLVASLSIAATFGVMVLVGFAVWLAVLVLAGVGRSLMGTVTNLPVNKSTISREMVTYLFNWESWSSLLATGSSVLAVLTGVVKGLSGWLWGFYQNIYKAMTLKRIQYRTVRSKKKRQKEINYD
jgi:hypothetical protein